MLQKLPAQWRRIPMTPDEIQAATQSQLRNRLQILMQILRLGTLLSPGTDEEAELIRAELAKRKGEGIEQ